MRRTLLALGMSGGLLLAVPAVAVAQPAPTPPPAPPTANCGFLSVVAGACQIPVSILVPVNIESVFPPQPTGQ